MANVNTVQSQVSGSVQNNIAALALGTSTTETLYSLQSNAFSGLGGGVVPIPVPDQGAVPSIYAGGKIVKFRATGTATTGDSESLTIKLYNVSAAQLAGLTATSFTAGSMAASSATTIATATAPFVVDATLQFDSVGGRIVGSASFEINGVLTALAATTIITGLVNDADLNFILSFKFGTGNAADVVNLAEVSIEQQ